MFGIFISQRISIDGIDVISIGLFFFIVQLLEKSVTAKEEMELDLFGKVRFFILYESLKFIVPTSQADNLRKQPTFHYVFTGLIPPRFLCGSTN